MTRCNECGRIRVAFGTAVMSFTRTGFEQYAALVEDKYTMFRDSVSRDEKVVSVATPVAGVSTILTVRELCTLRYLLSEGRTKLMHKELFSFSEN